MSAAAERWLLERYAELGLPRFVTAEEASGKTVDRIILTDDHLIYMLFTDGTMLVTYAAPDYDSSISFEVSTDLIFAKHTTLRTLRDHDVPGASLLEQELNARERQQFESSRETQERATLAALKRKYPDA